MSVVEFLGGPITHRYLMNKSKHDLARMYLELLDNRERFGKAAFGAGYRAGADCGVDYQGLAYDEERVNAAFHNWREE